MLCACVKLPIRWKVCGWKWKMKAHSVYTVFRYFLDYRIKRRSNQFRWALFQISDAHKTSLELHHYTDVVQTDRQTSKALSLQTCLQSKCHSNPNSNSISIFLDEILLFLKHSSLFSVLVAFCESYRCFNILCKLKHSTFCRFFTCLTYLRWRKWHVVIICCCCCSACDRHGVRQIMMLRCERQVSCLIFGGPYWGDDIFIKTSEYKEGIHLFPIDWVLMIFFFIVWSVQ